jgi:MoaA/NifB/PqqE/SkfB family radical SAM enzyme
VRGPGTFAATLAAMRRARAAEIEVSVMTTITRANKHEIWDLVELLGKEVVGTLAMERPMPEGAGTALRDNALTPEELHELYDSAYQLAKDHPPVRLLLHRPIFALVAPHDPTVWPGAPRGTTLLPSCPMLRCMRGSENLVENLGTFLTELGKAG